ncbi:MAG: hypothetical protein HGB12_06290, partial [Bacteroidetes bacterium]|nr:hypothetical protein [Bacteroidota bacterium]
MKRLFRKIFLLSSCLAYLTVFAQTVKVSTMQEQDKEYSKYNLTTGKQWDSLHAPQNQGSANKYLQTATPISKTSNAQVATTLQTPAVSENETLSTQKSDFGTAIGKRSIISKDWQKGEIFGEYKPEQEIVEKRTEFSKKFQIDTNKVRVIIGGPFHYKAANGAWEDIDLNIVPSNDVKYNYINETNKFVSKFGKDIKDGVNVNHNNNSVSFGINPNIWYNDNKPLAEFNKPEVSVNENKISYNNFYKDVKLEYEATSSALYQRWIFDNVSVFSGISNSENVSVTETVHLPSGAVLYDSLGLVNSDREIKGVVYVVKENDTISSFLSARIWDSKFTGDPINITNNESDDNGESIIFPVTKIKWKQDGIIDITVIIPVSWLVSPDRKYPVILDPTYFVEIFYPWSANYEYPWNTCCNTRTSQFYVLSGNIGYTGTITAVYFGQHANNALINNSASVGLFSTASDHFTGATLVGAGSFTNIYSGNLDFTTGGVDYWRGVSASYAYSTTTNLLVEAKFANGSHTLGAYTNGGVWYYYTSPNTTHCWAWNTCGYVPSGGTPAYGWNTPIVAFDITTCTAPGAPTLTAPTAGAYIQPGETTMTTFSWNAPTGTAPFTYNLYIGGSLVYTGSSTSWSGWFTGSSSDGWCGNYSWYVTATNACGGPTSSATRAIYMYPKYSSSTSDYSITPSTSCQSHSSSIVEGEAKYYSFNALAGYTYYFGTCGNGNDGWTCGSNTGWDTWLGIYYSNDNCTPVTSNDDGSSCSDGESFINGWVCSTSGTYYVKVCAYDVGYSGTYYLQYMMVSPCTNASAPTSPSGSG